MTGAAWRVVPVVDAAEGAVVRGTIVAGGAVGAGAGGVTGAGLLRLYDAPTAAWFQMSVASLARPIIELCTIATVPVPAATTLKFSVPTGCWPVRVVPKVAQPMLKAPELPEGITGQEKAPAVKLTNCSAAVL